MTLNNLCQLPFANSAAKIFAVGGLLVSSSLLATPADAFVLNFDSTSTSSNSPATGASASIDFAFSDVGAGQVQLDLTLTNTTGTIPAFGAGATQATLVGFGFDISSLITGGTYNPLTSPFTQLYNDASPVSVTPTNGATDEGSASLPPFGTFDLGIRSTGPGNFTGGNPTAGLTAGLSSMVSFLFDITSGNDASSLEAAFLAGFEDGSLSAATRFQQVNAGSGSDKLELSDDGIVDDGTVDDGTVDDGTVDDGTVDDGTVDDGTVDDGTVDDGTVDDGTVDDGTVDDGTVDDGTVDDGTVDDGTVDDGTVDDGTVDDGTVDDGTVDDGTVDDGTVDDGTVDDGTVDDGTVDDGTVDDGTVDDGTVDDGTVDDGTVDDGTVDDGGTEIPEPSTIGGLLLFLGGFVASRRKSR